MTVHEEAAEALLETVLGDPEVAAVSETVRYTSNPPSRCDVSAFDVVWVVHAEE